MIRECVDCGKQVKIEYAISAGGWCVPAATEYDFTPKESWTCKECKAKYPKPVQYVTQCDECDNGSIHVRHQCSGCDHGCFGVVKCEMCDGRGSYMTHDCNPGCDHNGLPEISASRGGITFANLE